jgi:hypothetical protein
MTWHARRSVIAVTVLLLAGCRSETSDAPPSDPATPTDAPQPTASPTPSQVDHEVRSRLVDVGGYRIAVRCDGSGEPALIFEGGHLNAQASADYSIVQATMVEEGVGRVCWYDRAGLGESEPRRPGPVDAARLAEELHLALERLDIRPPYVLAGGSFGGLLVRSYQQLYPAEVGGLMFIDAVEVRHPLVTLGALDVVVEGRSRIDMKALERELRSAPRLGDLPVIVITAGFEASELEWMDAQRRLADLSTNSIHFIARGASHGVTNEVPELVSEASKMLLHAAATRSRLPSCGASLEGLGARCVK